jgi:hypothetical protein
MRRLEQLDSVELVPRAVPKRTDFDAELESRPEVAPGSSRTPIRNRDVEPARNMSDTR